MAATATNMNEPEEEEDYMSMTIAEPVQSISETSIQRRARQKREAQLRAHPRTKAEIAAQELAAREIALATSLDSSNKGFQMMAKLGFKGGALGKASGGVLTEPIGVVMKEDKGGIGLDAEKKRKFREQVEGASKRQKATEGDYRDRMLREERLDEESHSELDEQDAERPKDRRGSRPTGSVNVLWRSLVRHRLEKERERTMRHDLQLSSTRLHAYEDPEMDKSDRHAIGSEEEELDVDDPELDEFNALEPEERLAKLVMHLRERHYYCFWCKFQYHDERMEGCPGVTEDDHD